MDDDDYGLLAIPGALLIFGVIIFVIGLCVSNDIKDEETKLSTMTTDQQIEYKHNIQKIEYEGHSYIIMSHDKYQNGICHDENCKCRNK